MTSSCTLGTTTKVDCCHRKPRGSIPLLTAFRDEHPITLAVRSSSEATCICTGAGPAGRGPGEKEEKWSEHREILAYNNSTPVTSAILQSPLQLEFAHSLALDGLSCCLVHAGSDCDCFLIDLSGGVSVHHGAIDPLPFPFEQDAPTSRIAVRTRDTPTKAIEEGAGAMEALAYLGEAAAAADEVTTPEEQARTATEEGVDLKEEQAESEALPGSHELQQGSAPSPLAHNTTTNTHLPPLTGGYNIAATETNQHLPITESTLNTDISPPEPQLSAGISAAASTDPAGASNGINTVQIPMDDTTQTPQQPFNAEISEGLGPPLALNMAAPDTSLQYTPNDFMDPVEPFPQQAQLPPATGFAKLEFLDGHFYMTTYAVELGRDMRAFRMAQQQAVRHQLEEEQQAKPRSKRSSSVPGTPARPIKGDGGASVARSFLSETGGIVGEDDGHISLKKRRKKSQKSRSTDTSSSRSHISRKNSLTHLHSEPIQAENETPTVDPNATAPLDPMVHMPDPSFTPLIPIHPPKSEDDPFPTGKGISRKHVRIAYNFDKGHFEMTVYGRNGAFHDDDHYGQDEVVALHDGSQVQIGGVFIKFVLPNVPVSEVGDFDDEPESVSGRMSFNFEDGRGESIVADDESIAESYQSADDEVRANGYDYENEWDFEHVEEEGEEDEGEEDESEDELEDESPKAVRQKLKIKAPPPKKAAKHSRKPSIPLKPVKASTKLKLKLTPKERARLEAQAKEKERLVAKAKKQARIAAEKAAREKERAQAKESKEPSNEPSKEASKTLAGEDGKTPKEPSAPRIARDVALENGQDITIPGLPAGVIIPPRKKGPGRPPKDGVMSKRERALLMKQAKEREKAIKLGLDPSQIPPPEMKPPKPRPRKNSQGEELEGDGQEPGVDGEEKRIKIPKPPRSPSPEMRIEDYTEEQLQRPTPNYVYLIYEAIQNSKTGVMNLQQIYSAIERRYPYFKFKTTSNGWQSSVRHNLGQHEAFRKVEKEGKGWLWGIKEGVPIERERKKKTPPPQTPSNPHQYAHPYQYPQYAGYPPQSGAPSYPPAYPPARVPTASLVPPSLQQQALKPPSSLAPSANPPGSHQTQTYSSPYAKDASKAGEGPSAQTQPSRQGPYGPQYPPTTHLGNNPHPPSPYQPHLPQYRNTPHPPSAGPLSQQQTAHASSSTPPLPPSQTASRPKYRLPAQDVIDTFKKVFISTYSSRDNIGPAKAEAIVNNAIKRVLEPESVSNVPLDPEEEGVAKAFEGILVQSQGPPRQATPSHPAVPHTATNAAATAALTAAAKAGASSPPNPSQPRSQAPGQTPLTTSAQQQPQPSRQAEANLMSMLMGGATSQADSGTPTALNSTPPVAPPPPAQAGSSTSAPMANPQQPLKINGLSKDSRSNGTSTPTRPAVEPLTPPAVATSPKPGAKRALSPQRDQEQDGKRARLGDDAENAKVE